MNREQWLELVDFELKSQRRILEFLNREEDEEEKDSD